MTNYSNFEWYYFDLHTHEGYDVVCTIHPRPFNSIFNIAIFDIFVYKNNKPFFHHFFIINVNNEKSSEGHFILKYDDKNYIKKFDDFIEVSMVDKTVNVKLSFKDILKINNPPKNELVNTNNGISLFNWVVYAPFCEGKAKLNWEDNHLDLEGNGYHDYNSGAANLKQIVKKWFWGKYYFENELFIYGEIWAKSGQCNKIALHVSKNNYTIEENPNKEEKNGKIYFSIPSKKFVFEIEPKQKIDDVSFYMSKFSGFTLYVKIMEALFHLSSKYSINIIKNFIANSRYIRFSANGKTTNDNDVSCFYEEMFL